jgi:copper transport protein
MMAALTVFGWLDLLASVVLAGGFLSAALITVPSPLGRRVARAAALVLGVVLIVEFVLTALRMSALAASTGGGLLFDVLAMRWGELWIVRVVGLAVLGAALRDRHPRWSLWAGAAALWLMARSFQGHAGAHGPMPALIDWLHLVAVAAWLGSLAQYASLEDDLSALATLRLRRLATAGIALVVPTGVYAAVLHVPKMESLLHSAYGQTLLVKIGFAAALIGLGAANHFRHVPALIGGEEGAARKLHRTALLELAVGAAILLLSALLGVLPMPHDMPSSSRAAWATAPGWQARRYPLAPVRW